MNNINLEEIETTLLDRLNKLKGKIDDTLFSAMHYALMSGGKRVRPSLMLMSARLLGIDESRVVPLYVAVEFIHTYSLVHDDLPSMDNDDFRRGRPTVHKVYGESVAILVGDAFLNLAYEILLDNILIDSTYIQSAKLIAECAGSMGMVGGQAAEFSFNSIHNSLEQDKKVEKILNIYKRKTGALICASVYAPFLLLPYQDSSMGKTLWQIAQNVGLIFQLVDDIIDYKDGTDADKPTAIAILGQESVLDIIKEKDAKNHQLLTSFGQESVEFLEYFTYLSHRII